MNNTKFSNVTILYELDDNLTAITTTESLLYEAKYQSFSSISSKPHSNEEIIHADDHYYLGPTNKNNKTVAEPKSTSNKFYPTLNNNEISSNISSSSSSSSSTDSSATFDGAITLVIIFLFIICFGWTPKAILNRHQEQALQQAQERHQQRQLELSSSSQQEIQNRRLRFSEEEWRQLNLLFQYSLNNIVLTQDSEEEQNENGENRINRGRLQRQRGRRSLMNSNSNSLMTMEERRKLILEALQIQLYSEYVQLNNNKKTLQTCCSICLAEYQEMDEVTTNQNNCQHVFHKECLLEWLLLNHEDCPCCRLPYINLHNQKQQQQQRQQQQSANLVSDAEILTQRNFNSNNNVTLQIMPLTRYISMSIHANEEENHRQDERDSSQENISDIETGDNIENESLNDQQENT